MENIVGIDKKCVDVTRPSYFAFNFCIHSVFFLDDFLWVTDVYYGCIDEMINPFLFAIYSYTCLFCYLGLVTTIARNFPISLV